MRRLALLGSALLLAASSASAEPTVWQRARDPGARLQARARLRAEQLFEQANESRSDPEAAQDLSLGSAALLELSGATHADAWQKVLLGRVLLEAHAGREREGVQLILAGLPGLPDSDFKRETWFDLGVAALPSGDLSGAERAFTAALALAWDPDDRATLYRNRGKARMLSGRLQAAVGDFRAAVRLARELQVVALSHFGLGVALERSGDYPQGMQEIARGVAIHLPPSAFPTESVLDLPGLIWTPAYDVHYYRALADMSYAGNAENGEMAEAAWEAALLSWEQYLPAAEAQSDRFVPNAQRHQKRCQEQLARLRQKQKRSGGVR